MLTYDHLVNEYAESPPIHGCSVSLCSNHLRCNVLCESKHKCQIPCTKTCSILTLSSDKRICPKITRTGHRIDHRYLERVSVTKVIRADRAKNILRLALTDGWWQVVPLDVPTV